MYGPWNSEIVAWGPMVPSGRKHTTGAHPLRVLHWHEWSNGLNRDLLTCRP